MFVGLFGCKMKLGHSGAGKMAERIKCLLLKREDLNLDAQHTHKSQVCVTHHNPSVVVELTGQPSQLLSSGFSERGSGQNRMEGSRGRDLVSPSGL